MINRHPVLATALIAVFAAISSTAAWAESPTPEAQGFQSTRTRAEVKADVLVAAATHRLLPAGEQEAGRAPAARFATTARADVKAEAIAARAAGTLLPAGEVIEVARATPSRTSVRATDLARR